MKRICLVVVGLYINLLAGFSQVTDSSQYKSRKLRTEEINFITSYYHQDGDHASVTGGIGTQKLTDFSNGFELKLYNYNRHRKRVNWDMNLGIDYYTSASSDNIDPRTISSPSSHDLRIYPSVTRTVMNEKNGLSVATSLYFSNETDYQSYGAGVGITKKSTDENRELSVNAQCYLDRVEIILPIELRNASTGGLFGADNEHIYPWKPRNTYNGSFSLSQVINKRLQVLFLLDLAYQHGYLQLPFHRIYFTNNAVGTERLPSSRFKIPLGIRANYFAGDHIILRSYYRYYQDDWGLHAHTAELEMAVKISPFLSVSPFYRYYKQTAIEYFAPYKVHSEDEDYYSSNYDLSAFSSHFFGTGFRYAPLNGLFGHTHWNMLELRYGHYKRTDGLHADIISLHFKYK